MAKYIVGSSMPGYLPTSDPYECGTLAEAKSAARAEAMFMAYDNVKDIVVWSPLNSIRKSDLVSYGVPITYAVIGEIEVWIAIESD